MRHHQVILIELRKLRQFAVHGLATLVQASWPEDAAPSFEDVRTALGQALTSLATQFGVDESQLRELITADSIAVPERLCQQIVAAALDSMEPTQLAQALRNYVAHRLNKYITASMDKNHPVVSYALLRDCISSAIRFRN